MHCFRNFQDSNLAVNSKDSKISPPTLHLANGLKHRIKSISKLTKGNLSVLLFSIILSSER